MKSLQENLIKKSVCQKHKANKHSTRKTIGCFAETIGCLYQFTNIKLNLKSSRDREIEHTGLYWFTLNQELHPVFPETPGEFTKQSTLDYLQHHQRSDLDPLKTHTSFGSAQTPLRMLILTTSRTQHFSASHTEFLQSTKGLHLLQKRSEINTR